MYQLERKLSVGWTSQGWGLQRSWSELEPICRISAGSPNVILLGSARRARIEK
jgi:hypothetical protein